MVFHWSLSDSKSPQVSRTRLSILAVLSNAVVLIVSTRPPISKSSRPFNNPLVTVPNAPITIGTIVPQLFYFSSKVEVLILFFFFSLPFRFILWSAGTAKSTILLILVFLLIIMRSGLDYYEVLLLLILFFHGFQFVLPLFFVQHSTLPHPPYHFLIAFFFFSFFLSGLFFFTVLTCFPLSCFQSAGISQLPPISVVRFHSPTSVLLWH